MRMELECGLPFVEMVFAHRGIERTMVDTATKL